MHPPDEDDLEDLAEDLGIDLEDLEDALGIDDSWGHDLQGESGMFEEWGIPLTDDQYADAQDFYNEVHTREEIVDYIDALADAMDVDAHDLYDLYYGYADVA